MLPTLQEFKKNMENPRKRQLSNPWKKNSLALLVVDDFKFDYWLVICYGLPNDGEFYMGVSINGGTQKWLVYNGKSH